MQTDINLSRARELECSVPADPETPDASHDAMADCWKMCSERLLHIQLCDGYMNQCSVVFQVSRFTVFSRGNPPPGWLRLRADTLTCRLWVSVNAKCRRSKHFHAVSCRPHSSFTVFSLHNRAETWCLKLLTADWQIRGLSSRGAFMEQKHEVLKIKDESCGFTQSGRLRGFSVSPDSWAVGHTLGIF